MKYRELLRKYIDGQLEPEEREKIEAEIEKHEAISDYLYDEGGIDDIVVHAEEKQENDTNAEFVQIINRSIRKAFMKLGVAVTAIVLAVVLFCIYGLSPLVSLFYYNPGKEVGEFTNQMSLDWSVYSELTMPGLKRDSVNVVDKGYGKYNIVIQEVVSRDNIHYNASGEINRGKFFLYDENVLRKPVCNIFACYGYGYDYEREEGETLSELYAGDDSSIYHMWAGSSGEKGKKDLEALSDEENYIGYVSFEEDMNFEELMKFLEEIEYKYPEWCAVRVGDSANPLNLGYTMERAGMQLEGWDAKKYPDLSVLFDGATPENSVENEEWCENHFRSMLRYLGEQKKFTKMVNTEWDFDAIEDYIEENGLNYYGIAVVAPKETLLKINEHEQVFGIYTVSMP